MTRKILIAFSAAAMVALSAGATVASASNSVTVLSKPVLGGGVTDGNGNLKVYGGQTAAAAVSNQKVGNSTVATQVTRSVSILPSVDPDDPTDQTLWQFTSFLGYQYSWYRYNGSTYTLIGSQATFGQTGARNFAKSQVGYKIVVRQSPVYSDPNDGLTNITSDLTTPGDISYSDPSPIVTFFASSNPTFSLTSGMAKLTSYGVWQGWTTNQTKTFQWQACTGESTGCSDISGATGRKIRLTSAQNGKYIRVKVTVTTTNGFGVSSDAYSPTQGYNLPV